MWSTIKNVLKDTLYGFGIILSILMIFALIGGFILFVVYFPFIFLPILLTIFAWYIGKQERQYNNDDWRD